MMAYILVGWLDPLFSLTKMGNLVVIFGGLLLVLVLGAQKKAIFHYIARSLFALGFILGIVAAFNDGFFGYGYLHEDNIPYFGMSNNYIAIKDVKIRPPSRGPEKIIHRVYLVDQKSGAIISKKVVDEQIPDTMIVHRIGKEKFTQITTAKDYFYHKDRERTSKSLMNCSIHLSGLNYNTLGGKRYYYSRLRACFDKHDCGIIKSYQTNKKVDEIFTAINAKNKVYWQKTAEKLGVTDFFSSEQVELHYTTPILGNGEIICLIGGYLLRLNPKTGKVRWKTRL